MVKALFNDTLFDGCSPSEIVEKASLIFIAENCDARHKQESTYTDCCYLIRRDDSREIIKSILSSGIMFPCTYMLGMALFNHTARAYIPEQAAISRPYLNEFNDLLAKSPGEFKHAEWLENVGRDCDWWKNSPKLFATLIKQRILTTETICSYLYDVARHRPYDPEIMYVILRSYGSDARFFYTAVDSLTNYGRTVILFQHIIDILLQDDYLFLSKANCRLFLKRGFKILLKKNSSFGVDEKKLIESAWYLCHRYHLDTNAVIYNTFLRAEQDSCPRKIFIREQRESYSKKV